MEQFKSLCNILRDMHVLQLFDCTFIISAFTCRPSAALLATVIIYSFLLGESDNTLLWGGFAGAVVSSAIGKNLNWRPQCNENSEEALFRSVSISLIFSFLTPTFMGLSDRTGWYFVFYLSVVAYWILPTNIHYAKTVALVFFQLLLTFSSYHPTLVMLGGSLVFVACMSLYKKFDSYVRAYLPLISIN